MRILRGFNSGNLGIILPGKYFIFQVLLFLLTLLAFYPVLNADFLNFDDHMMVFNNPHIKKLSADSVWNLFTSWKIGLTYQPLTHLLYSLVFYSFGPDAFYFLLTNIFIHAFNVVLFFSIAVAVGISLEAAFGVALLFGIHPTRVDSVAWISELKGILFSFFYLSALLSHIRKNETENTGVSARTFILYLFALLAKPMAVSFPLVIAAYDAIYRNDSLRTNIKNKLLLLLPAILITYLTLLAHAPEQVNSIRLNLTNRFLVPLFGLGYLLAKLIFPVNMALLLDYPTYVTNLLIPQHIPYFLIGVIFPIFLLRETLGWKNSDRSAAIFGLWFFILSVFPMLQIIPFGMTITAVRYVYLPAAGLLLAIGFLSDRLTEKTSGKVILALLFAIVIPASFGMTRTRCEYWSNSVTFWTRVIQECPTFDAHLGRGQAFLQMRDFPVAIYDFTKALEIDPKDVEARTDRARAYMEAGHLDEAKIDIEKVVSEKPTISKPYFTLGLVLLRNGEYGSSIGHFNKAIELSPENADSYLNRGVAFKKKGEFKRAIDDFSRAHKLFGDHPFIFINLAQTYKAMGNIDEARKNAEKAHQLGAHIGEDF